ncbi:MAG TPA: hypothetical protein VF353_02305, partial [Candidatus Binatia bacterium]
SLDVRKEYACARPFSRALHLDRFEQPGISCIALRVQLETAYTKDKVFVLSSFIPYLHPSEHVAP